MNMFHLCDVGTSHVGAGRENQDRIAVRRLDDTLLVTMADGMGLLPNSAQGAQAAVAASMDTLCRTIMPGKCFSKSAPASVRAAFAAAYNAVRSLPDPSNCLCTLMVVAADLGKKELHFGYVGDGCLAVSVGDWVYELEDPQKGELPGQTYSVAHEDMWRFGSTAFDSFLLATDGIGDALCEGFGGISLDELLLGFEAMAEDQLCQMFPSGPDEWAKGSILSSVTDDRSLFIAASEKVKEEVVRTLPKASSSPVVSNVPAQFYLPDPPSVAPPKPHAPHHAGKVASDRQCVHYRTDPPKSGIRQAVQGWFFR